MMLGGWNPLPAQLGGLDSPARALHLSLRSAVGVGGAGPMWDAGGIEDLWRWSKALGLWAAAADVDGAAAELLPATMFHHLDRWESELRLPSDGPIETRRQAVETAIYAAVSGVLPEIESYLRQNFDDEITILSETLEAMSRCESHRYLEGASSWGASDSSALANLSSAFYLRILWPSLETESQLRPLQRALNVRLPAWVNYAVFNAIGFVLDGGPDGSSLLDITAMA